MGVFYPERLQDARKIAVCGTKIAVMGAGKSLFSAFGCHAVYEIELDKAGACVYHLPRMKSGTEAPHVLFRQMLDILDGVRRESVQRVNSTQQKRMYGLTMRQSTALSHVKELMEQEPQGVALKTLAQNLQMTVPAASLLVEAMVGKGFLARTPNPQDRRAVCIKISEKGTALFEDVYAVFHRQMDELASRLSPQELEALAAIITKLKQ